LDLQPVDVLTGVNFERIRDAVDPPALVTYECAHVYPLSAPDFRADLPGDLARPKITIDKLYVHVPFCNYACRFCFYVKQVGAHITEKRRLVRCLINELERVQRGTVLSQIYIGGGTPTALPADLLDTLINSIKERASLAPDATFTVECSPESLGAEHLSVLRSHGINRISVGVDTLDENILREINRRHDRHQALNACRVLLETDAFINVDLIYGFSGQTEESFIKDLQDLAALRPHSFTAYSLRLNEQTPLLKTKGDSFRGDLERLMRWRAVVERAAREAGYMQTRMHTFVHESVTRNHYKRAPCIDGYSFGRQLGVGPSALSHLGYRLYLNAESIKDYIERAESGENTVGSGFDLSGEDQRTLFVARTLGEGLPLPLSDYESVFGHTFEHDFGPTLNRLERAGLVLRSDDTLLLSGAGRLVHDLVLRSFYPEKAKLWLDKHQPQF
jgi:oxygen-independent coproporphyrinogen-3 oxidase